MTTILTDEELREIEEALGDAKQHDFVDRLANRTTKRVFYADHGTLNSLDRAVATIRHLKTVLAEETAIVDRTWKALGIETYEQARGKSIDQLVSDLKSAIAALDAEVEE